MLLIDHAGYTAPTRQHELYHTDHTDHTNHTDQEYICLPGRSRSCTVVGTDHTDHLSEVWTLVKVRPILPHRNLVPLTRTFTLP